MFGLASMRKASLEAGDSSGSDDGRQSMRGGRQYARLGQDLALGLEEFPTFIPRNVQEESGYNISTIGPVGSGRPARILRQYPGA